MNSMIQKLFDWYGKRNVIAVTVVIAVLLVAGGTKVLMTTTNTSPTTQEQQKLVTVAAVSSFTGGEGFVTVGTLEAQNEAVVQSEIGGRLTSVRVDLGDHVSAGQILATLENASQRAALTQAQGSYEAAVAAAQQSDVAAAQAKTSLEAAKQNAISAIRNTFTTAQGAVYNSIDTFYANPKFSTPGVRISGSPSEVSYLNNERVRLQTILPKWQTRTASLTTEDDLIAEIQTSISNLNMVIGITEQFLELFRAGGNGIYTDAEMLSYSSSFSSLLNTLNAQRSALVSSQTAIQNATQAYQRAQLGGTEAEVSSANAQVKQARGALEAAQANYAKTILRAPITGEVISLTMKNGNFISAYSPLATITNQNGLIVKTFVNTDVATHIAVGDHVTINGTVDAVVTNKASAVSKTTGKVEVRIGVSDSSLTSGTSVDVQFKTGETNTSDDTDVMIPLTAVKLTADAAYVFTIENGILVAHTVTLGEPTGSKVGITSGIDPTWTIVTDARGLSDGMEVEVRN